MHKRGATTPLGSHYVVDGMAFSGANAVWQYAKREHGFSGTLACMLSRLKKRAHTWEALAAPIKNDTSPQLLAYARKKDEMAAMIAAYDKRKAETE